MQISSGENRMLSGVINETINMEPNSNLELNNVTLNGSINGDITTSVTTIGNCIINGSINCGNLNIGGGSTSIGGGGTGSLKCMLGSIELQPGDWLMKDGDHGSAYKHHFIYIGGREFVSKQTNSVLLEDAGIYDGKKCWLIHRGGKATADCAKARVGEGGYNLISNNCEHFCSEVSGLGHHSEQVFVSSGKALVKLGSVLGNYLSKEGSNVTFTSGAQGGFSSMGGFSGGIKISF